VNIEKEIDRAISLIRRGYTKERIIKKISSNFDAEEIYEIARCRIKIKDKFSKKNLYFDTYGLRYSTPEIIGRYRAERVKGYRIADISCGVGMQAIFFAQTNKEILCVDIDKRRIEYAKRNAKAYGVKNMQFLVGDCCSDEIYNIAKGYDIIFSDPARKEAEKERDLKNLLPSPLKIMEKYGERDYIFDLPPQISQNKIPENWEKEYISLNSAIRRLTAYVGDLHTVDRRAVALPLGAVLESNDENLFTLKREFSNYVYIVDEAPYYAHLLGELERKYPGLWYISTGKRRTLASSNNLISSPFLRAFKVLYYSENLEYIIKFLRQENYGKVTLRLSLNPKEYWKVRKRIEGELSGDDKVSLFHINGFYVVAKDVT